MVSKSVTILSFLLPIAMVIGTSIAIYFYEYSTILLILIAIGGLMVCAYVLILKSQKHRSAR
ncbi:Uncharacterised protein [uncultured archaeon]|nr:Uncharacterised protein [uncultured archaeon]